MPRLYTTPLSANGRKPLAVCRHLGLELEVELVDVYRGEGRRPAFLLVSPSGRIPVLVDGELVLSESNAILVYLSEALGGYRLWSRDPRRRAEIARWLFWEASQWQPALVPVLVACVGRLVVPALVATPPVAVDWADARLRPLLDELDAHLAPRRFLAADEPTLADFSVAGMMTYARAAAFPFDAFPAIAAWYRRIEALPAWQATAAGPWR